MTASGISRAGMEETGPFSFAPEATPLHLTLSALLAGFSAPALSSEFSYLDLNCDRNPALAILAAGNPGSFAGLGGMPMPMLADLVRASGLRLSVLGDNLSGLCAHGQGRPFDMIAIRGAWSWMSDQERHMVVDVVRRHLKPGGLVYLSYEVQPEWPSALSVADCRRLQRAIATRRLGSGGRAGRVGRASDMGSDRASDALAGPSAAASFQAVGVAGRADLARAFLGAQWRPASFASVARRFVDAGLVHVGSARFASSHEGHGLSPDEARLLGEIDDAITREAVRDCCLERRVRHDIFTLGRHRLSEMERILRLRERHFILLDGAAVDGTKQLGTACSAVLDMFRSADADLRSLAELEERGRKSGFDFATILDAILFLCETGQLAPAHDRKTLRGVMRSAQELNDGICHLAEWSPDMAWLAVPATGSGIPVNRIEQLLLRGLSHRRKDVPAYVLGVLRGRGEGLFLEEARKGVASEDDLTMLRRLYSEFTVNRMPLFDRLGIR